MNANFTALKVAINDTDNKCGDLTTLATTAKTSLVAAVNEVNGKIPTGALTSVTTDTSLTGNGTAATPLGINFAAGNPTDARYLQLAGTSAQSVTGPGVTFSAPALASTTQAVTVTVAPGTGTTTTTDGAGAISASAGKGFTPSSTGAGGNGGTGATLKGGDGGIGESNPAGNGGDGVHASGGVGGTVGGLGAPAGRGGIGLVATGGSGDINGVPVGNGGEGVNAQGGNSGGIAGTGVKAHGGFGAHSTTANGTGGTGVFAQGGDADQGASSSGNGGDGIQATPGSPGPISGTQGNAAVFNGDVLVKPFGSSLGNLNVSNDVTSATLNVSGNVQLGNGVPGATSIVIGVAGTTTDINGNVSINGIVFKTASTFKIDHPLDPENKFLYHSVIESPDMMNVYNGNVVLDTKGEATVELPSYFETLNKDFRYQLTCVGGAAVVYIAEKIHENRFKIAGGREGLEVSWQVTGIRQDAWANAHRIQTEVEKSPSEKGKFLHPVELGRPESAKIGATAVAAKPAPQRPAPAKDSKHD
jgi:hypothetical protein